MPRSEGGTTNAQMAQLFDPRAVLALYESELVQRWLYGKEKLPFDGEAESVRS